MLATINNKGYVQKPTCKGCKTDKFFVKYLTGKAVGIYIGQKIILPRLWKGRKVRILIELVEQRKLKSSNNHI